jgi:hypothetical protein
MEDFSKTLRSKLRSMSPPVVSADGLRHIIFCKPDKRTTAAQTKPSDRCNITRARRSSDPTDPRRSNPASVRSFALNFPLETREQEIPALIYLTAFDIGDCRAFRFYCGPMSPARNRPKPSRCRTSSRAFSGRTFGPCETYGKLSVISARFLGVARKAWTSPSPFTPNPAISPSLLIELAASRYSGESGIRSLRSDITATGHPIWSDPN